MAHLKSQHRDLSKTSHFYKTMYDNILNWPLFPEACPARISMQKQPCSFVTHASEVSGAIHVNGPWQESLVSNTHVSCGLEVADMKIF